MDSGTGAVTGLDDQECQIAVVLSANAYHDLEHTYTFTVGKGTIQIAGNTNAAKWGSYPTMEVGVARTELAPATGATTPAGVDKVYRSLTPAICSATPQGAVSASTHGPCRVKLVLSIDNYFDKEYTYSFNVTKGTIAVAGADAAAKWGTYPALTVGTSVDAPDTGDITPSGVGKTYSSLTASVCTVDARGAVTGLDDAECQVKLVLSIDNYFDLAYTYTFTVGKGTIAVAGSDEAARWGSYGTVQVGAAGATSAPTVGTLTPSDTTKSYTSDTPAVCSVDARGAVTGIDDASCEITLTLSRNNYNDRTHTYTLTVEAGAISVAGATDTAKWGSYGAVTVGGGVTPAPVIGTVTPTGAAKAYTSLTTSACNAYETTGEVTAVAASAGNCRIRLTLSADGYEDTTKTYTFSVGKGTQTGVAWNPGSTTTHLGAGSVELGAVSGADSSSSITYSVVSAGETGCAFGSGSDVNLRTLSFSALGTCQVKATVTRAEYNDWSSGTIDITVASSPPVGISWTGYGSGANTAGYGNTAPGLDTPTLNPATATATYTHTGSACSVTSDGTLTVLALGTCQVTLTATPADSNNLAATATVTVTVGKGTQPAPATPANMYGANPTLVTGGTLSVVNAPTGGHGEPSYVVWPESRSVCRLDNATGEITALLNGNCIVVFNWTGDANYLPSSRQAIFNIEIGKGTIAITDAGSYTGTLTVGGESLTPSAPTATPAGASFAYALKAGESDCTLNSGTTGEVTANAVAITSGTECEVVLTASKTGYNDATADIAIPMQGAQLTFATPPLYPRNALALSGTLRPDPLPPSTDDNSIAVTWTFSAAGTRSGSTQTGVCSVNNDSTNADFGLVTAGSSAQADDICTVTVTASTTTSGYDSWSRSVPLTLRTSRILQLATGAYQNCVIIEGRGLKCWGHNYAGKLGYGDNNDRGDGASEMGSDLPFVNVGAGLSVRSVSMGYSSTCAVLTGGVLKCWGENHNGQLGQGDTSDRSSPPSTGVNLGTGRTAVHVSNYYLHTCAVLDDGSVKCWGARQYSRLGYSPHPNSDYHAPIDATLDLGTGRTAQMLDVGSYTAFAVLDNGSLVSWGGDPWGYGTLGDGASGANYNYTPTSVSLGVGVTAKFVASGNSHACAILNNDTLKCWGKNSYGRLGDNTTTHRPTPVAVDLGTNVTAKAVATGDYHTCAILNDDSVKCWGRNNRGQLGQGDTTDRSAPVAVNLGTNKSALMISAGDEHTCAVLNDHTVKCWGHNRYGQLGVGTANSGGEGTTVWGDGANEMGDNLSTVDLL